jgi:hypothetical protein
MVPSISQGRLPFSRETNLPEKPHLLPTARFFSTPQGKPSSRNTPSPYWEVNSIPKGETPHPNAQELLGSELMHLGPTNPSKWEACVNVP